MADGMDAAALHEAALTYLARYSATRARVRQVLLRRIDRWARQQADPDTAAAEAAAARVAVDEVMERLTRAGLLDDAAFAGTRAQGLVRAGKSSRAIQMKLVARGVETGLARDASLVSAEDELAAALVLARRRRMGPFRAGTGDEAAIRQKELGTFARAGFARAVAEQALEMDVAEAERRIADLRR